MDVFKMFLVIMILAIGVACSSRRNVGSPKALEEWQKNYRDNLERRFVREFTK